MSKLEKEFEDIVSSIKITFTNKILFFPCLASRPGVEYLSHKYFCPEVLVFSYELPYEEERMIEALLESKYDEKYAKANYIKYFNDQDALLYVDNLILEYAYKSGFNGRGWNDE